MVDGNKKTKAELLEVIGEKILSEMNSSDHHAGLMSGKTGFTLFLTNLYLVTKNEKYIHPVYQFVQRTLENTRSLVQGKPICNGIAGFVWFLKFLESKSLMEDSLAEIIGDDLKQDLFEYTENSFDENWDFLHGALGVAHVFKNNARYRKLVVEKLKESVISEQDGAKYWVQDRISTGKLNFGFAHGVPSILNYLSDGFTDDADELDLINSCFFSMEKERLPLGSKSIFPSSRGSNSWSRLAWCYGDLSIAHVMSKYYKKQKEGLELALFSAKRKKIEDTLIYDAGFCHGSAGVAQLFRRLSVKYCHPELQLANEFWLKKTKVFITEKNFQFWDSVDEEWKDEYTLINGLAGAGLVLLGLDNGWDDCFMLS